MCRVQSVVGICVLTSLGEVGMWRWGIMLDAFFKNASKIREQGNVVTGDACFPVELNSVFTSNVRAVFK